MKAGWYWKILFPNNLSREIQLQKVRKILQKIDYILSKTQLKANYFRAQTNKEQFEAVGCQLTPS